VIILILIVLGLCCGSFINALAWRMRQQEKGRKGRDISILRGRSMCSSCGHELAVRDLIPVLSYLSLRGRCRYCHQPIADKPVVEVVTAAVFVISYLCWPLSLGASGQRLLFVTWLLTVVGLLALAVYDFLWMELPNRILYPTFFVAAAGRLAYISLYSADKPHDLYLWVLSLVVASGIFLLIFIISQGRWIGYGDVRLGLVTGTLLATPAKSFLMIFVASILGTLFVIPGVLAGKKSATSRLPFGPFLIIASMIILLFGDSLINWYQNHLL